MAVVCGDRWVWQWYVGIGGVWYWYVGIGEGVAVVCGDRWGCGSGMWGYVGCGMWGYVGCGMVYEDMWM